MCICQEKDLNAEHSNGITNFVINVETEGLDKAIAKANELVELLSKANELTASLSSYLSDP